MPTALQGTADATLILGLLTCFFADVKDAEPINDKESYSFVNWDYRYWDDRWLLLGCANLPSARSYWDFRLREPQ